MNMETGYESPTDIEPDDCAAPVRRLHAAHQLHGAPRPPRHPPPQQYRASSSPTAAIRRRWPTSNQAYGVDAAFSFFQNVTANAYYARSESQNRDGDEGSYQGKVDYSGDR